MKATIIGNETSGKQGLFDILIQGNTFKSKGKLLGSANVPDQRVDVMSSVFKPKKTTYTQLQFLSVSLEPVFPFEDLRSSDVFVFVIKAYPQYPGDEVNVLKEYEDIDMLFRVKDIELLEKFIDRHKKDPKAKKEVGECTQLISLIENQRDIPDSDILHSDIIKNLGLHSVIPRIVVFNISEEDIQENTSFEDTWNKSYGALEEELNVLNEYDRKELMKEYAIEEPGFNHLIHAVYDYLGLQTFFTVGEDEVKAWTIQKNTSALEAAGKIHSDIKKGFIRAEIIHYEDFKKHNFSMKECKENGCFFVEGKEYVLQDGDIMHVRFNV
jgi:ribosome-binding ATPase YchF (GTP1/OBG family)